jgi:hypothetical protein
MEHKMKKPSIRIHNAETNEVIDREMTDDEFAQYQVIQLSNAAQAVETQAIATQRQEILDRLGLTADEAKLLLG